LALNLVANNPSAGDIAHGAALMTAFSLGLGIPFLIAALMLDSAQSGLRRILRHMGAIKLVSGGFLVLVGLVIATGRLQSLSAEFNGRFGDVSYRIEQCTVGVFEGDVKLGQYGSCLSGEQDFETIKAQNNGEEVLVAPQINAEVETPSENGNISMAESPVDTALDLGAISSIESVAEEIVAPVGLRVGNQAPNFSTTTLDGDEVSLVDYRGKVVILNFWFTTCAPCRVEMPEFQNLTNEYGGQDVVILSVNREESATAIADFRDDLNLTFPLLLDESGEIQDLYGIQGYPSSFILDRNGVIQFRTFSAMTVEQIQELVQSALS
jgi:peroxiredoxin